MIIFTKILAFTGTVFVWFPIIAPLSFSVTQLIKSQTFHLDYLMTAEFFPIALAGGALLAWAALRAGVRRGLIGWSFVTAFTLLVAGQLLASFIGLTSGETEPAGWPWILVLGMIIGYTLALIVTGIGGFLLLYDLVVQRKAPIPE